jgi:sister chromatid cohesion protein PDS5
MRKPKGSSPSSVFTTSILSIINKKSDAILHLRTLYTELVKLEQDIHTAPAGFDSVVTELISPVLIENNDKEIRLLVGCCLTEVLRIYAPEAPYRDNEMLRVFRLLIALIRGLETQNPTSPIGEMMLKILQSLATVKSCVVPVIMAQTGIAGAQETVHALFEASIALIRPEHPEEGIFSVFT